MYNLPKFITLADYQTLLSLIMKKYFERLFAHEHWANLCVLEAMVSAPKVPLKVLEIFSHEIAIQRIWLDRINDNDSEVHLDEVFNLEIMLELLEINYTEMMAIIEKQDFNQLIAYKIPPSNIDYVITVHEILTHLLLHAAHHRGQIALLLRQENLKVPEVDFIIEINTQQKEIAKVTI